MDGDWLEGTIRFDHIEEDRDSPSRSLWYFMIDKDDGYATHLKTTNPNVAEILFRAQDHNYFLAVNVSKDSDHWVNGAGVATAADRDKVTGQQTK